MWTLQTCYYRYIRRCLDFPPKSTLNVSTFFAKGVLLTSIILETCSWERLILSKKHFPTPLALSTCLMGTTSIGLMRHWDSKMRPNLPLPPPPSVLRLHPKRFGYNFYTEAIEIIDDDFAFTEEIVLDKRVIKDSEWSYRYKN